VAGGNLHQDGHPCSITTNLRRVTRPLPFDESTSGKSRLSLQVISILEAVGQKPISRAFFFPLSGEILPPPSFLQTFFSPSPGTTALSVVLARCCSVISPARGRKLESPSAVGLFPQIPKSFDFSRGPVPLPHVRDQIMLKSVSNMNSNFLKAGLPLRPHFFFCAVTPFWCATCLSLWSRWSSALGRRTRALLSPPPSLTRGTPARCY